MPDRSTRPPDAQPADARPADARRIPEATVARLPLYYRALLEITERGVETTSSERLAELAGVNAAQVRKDLSYLGSYGTRGVGYEVAFLVERISSELGLTHDWPVAIVGVGNLGQALANYRGFGARGFRVLALVDEDPAKVGGKVGDLEIQSLDDLPELVRARGITIGIVAVACMAAGTPPCSTLRSAARCTGRCNPAAVTPRSSSSSTWCVPSGPTCRWCAPKAAPSTSAARRPPPKAGWSAPTPSSTPMPAPPA